MRYACVYICVCSQTYTQWNITQSQKEWYPAIYNNLDEPWGYSVKCNKSDTGRQIPYTLSYMWNLRYRYENESVSHSVRSDSLQPHGLQCPWNSPGQNTGMGSHSLLQWIFPTQGSNPGLLHYRWILYQLSHQGSPRILKWVVYPFSSRSSWPRNVDTYTYVCVCVCVCIYIYI